ncbi:hypothetical protein Droror1_Dr00009090 [Drosera rotundifolia]
MGSKASRSSSSSSSGSSTSNNNLPSSIPQPPPPPPPTLADVSSKDLTSYLSAVQFDQDLRLFDSTLHDRTSRIITSLADGAVNTRSIPVSTLADATGSLIDSNREVVRIILRCKEDIWDNKDVLDLVNDYFDYSIQTLDFFAALDRCLKKAADRQLILRVALLHFEEESKADGDVSPRYARTIEELRNFKDAGDPFTEEFFALFRSVYDQQMRMFEKLTDKKNKLDKKLKRVRVYRKVSNFIFIAAFVGVIICSAVAAAIAAPHLVAALAASAASAPLATVGTWLDKLWKKYEDDLKGQRDLIGVMHVGTCVSISDLDSISRLVDRLEVRIESLLQNVDLVYKHEDAVTLVIEEIKKKVDVFNEEIEQLIKHAEKYRLDVSRARTVILNKIIRYPTRRSN